MITVVTVKMSSGRCSLSRSRSRSPVRAASRDSLPVGNGEDNDAHDNARGRRVHGACSRPRPSGGASPHSSGSSTHGYGSYPSKKDRPRPKHHDKRPTDEKLLDILEGFQDRIERMENASGFRPSCATSGEGSRPSSSRATNKSRVNDGQKDKKRKRVRSRSSSQSRSPHRHEGAKAAGRYAAKRHTMSTSGSETEASPKARRPKRHRSRSQESDNDRAPRPEKRRRKVESSDLSTDEQSGSESDGYGALRQKWAGKTSTNLDSTGQVGAQAAGSDDPKFEQVLKGLSEFFSCEEDKGPKINESFANIFQSSLRKKPGAELTEKLCKKYPRPENVENMRVPKTNDQVFSVMNKGPKYVDIGIQKAQLMLLKGLGPIITIIDDIGKGKKQPMETYLESCMDSLRLVTAAFSSLSQVRKDVVRNDVKEMTKLCTWETPVGKEDLFGVDVMKKLDEVKKSKKLKVRDSFGGKNRNQNYNSRTRFQGYGSYRGGSMYYGRRPNYNYHPYQSQKRKNAEHFLGGKKKYKGKKDQD